MTTADQRVRSQAFAEMAEEYSIKYNNPLAGEFWSFAMRRKVLHGDGSYLEFMTHLNEFPVGIEDFLDSPNFMGSTDLKLWPEVRKSIVSTNKHWWRGLSHGGIGEAILAGATGCVDAETEFLTPTGWRKISDYQEGDKVAQYYIDGTVDFVEPEGYVKNPFPYFYKFKNRNFDQLLTPGHRVIYKSVKTGKLQEKPAEDIVDLHNGSKRGWGAGEFIGSFNLSYGANDAIDLNVVQIRLMVAVQADGYFPKNYKERRLDSRYCTVHIKKQHKIDRLRGLLDATGIHYNEHKRTNGYTDFSFKAPIRSKNYDDWWMCNYQDLEVITDEVLYWDGSFGRGDGEYFTRNKRDADFIQYAFTATGRRATINTSQRQDGSVDYVVHLVKSKMWRLASSTKQNIETVPSEDGYCYCFKVPTSMWVSRRNGKIVVTGNTGKTEQAKVCIAYHLHILGCMKVPQEYWSLPSFTSIVFIIQAAKPNVVKKIIYAPLRKMIEAMPWFQKNLLPDPRLESEMYFVEKNIRVVPGGADDDAILGEAIIGGIIDEINFMAVVQNSKKVQEQTGRSGVYDQAHSVYTAITSRKKGRFLRPGVSIGVIIPSSSTRFVGDYTDRLMKAALDNDRIDVHIYNKAQYEVTPQERYSGETFNIQVANGQIADTRILEEHEKPTEGSRVLRVPIEYIDDFKQDIYRALRDICGISDNAVHPFIKRRSEILACIDKGKEQEMEKIVIKENVILGVDGMPNVVPGHYCKNPSKPRYVHIDLSHTSDRCGISMIRYDGMITTRKGDIEEDVPTCTAELAISIEPDLDNGIDLAELRAWVRMLKEQYGYPIKAVSLDNWQSLEFRQQLKKKGIKTIELSVDKTSTPYKLLRDAIYDNRISLPDNSVLVDELCGLEYDQNKDKIDHQVTGSKDCVSGDTEISLLDGTSRRIDSLIGEEFWVYSCTEEGRVTAGYAHNVHLVGTKSVIRIHLDNDEYLDCTPDHEIMLRDGSFVAAGRLLPDDSLMPLYRDYSVANSKTALNAPTNHKVVRVEKLDKEIPVYDMTVNKHHNFAIKQGIFIHNCADGVCGAYYLLLQRASTWQDGGRRYTSDRQGAGDRPGGGRADVKRDEAVR